MKNKINIILYVSIMFILFITLVTLIVKLISTHVNTVNNQVEETIKTDVVVDTTTELEELEESEEATLENTVVEDDCLEVIEPVDVKIDSITSGETLENNNIQNNNEEDSGIISLGEFKLTAYCSCERCCGVYALNRPLDENGNEIVTGSIGERLVAGVSIAVDPKVIPYGSKVIINGNTYIAQDTGGSIKGNRIDVYHNDHQEALNFGVRYAEVFIVNN